MTVVRMTSSSWVRDSLQPLEGVFLCHHRIDCRGVLTSTTSRAPNTRLLCLVDPLTSVTNYCHLIPLLYISYSRSKNDNLLEGLYLSILRSFLGL